MSEINIKLLTEENLQHMKKNIDRITNLISKNESNDWIHTEFSKPIFSIKTIRIEDFELKENPDSKDKEIDKQNSISLYEHLKSVPRYILTDEKFWLWLYLEKFYSVTRSIMPVTSKSTVSDHWMFKQGQKRGLMFGALSRCYFRIELTIDDKYPDKYMLSKWVIENPYRFRELSWRAFSSNATIVRNILLGEYQVIEIDGKKEDNDVYPQIAKYVSQLGSVRLLDLIDSKDMSSMIYNKMIELLG